MWIYFLNSENGYKLVETDSEGQSYGDESEDEILAEARAIGNILFAEQKDKSSLLNKILTHSGRKEISPKTPVVLLWDRERLNKLHIISLEDYRLGEWDHFAEEDADQIYINNLDNL